jgi:hypothetical protein
MKISLPKFALALMILLALRRHSRLFCLRLLRQQARLNDYHPGSMPCRFINAL